ncbi:T9SS type A sorting domain-containing protein [Ekhidna sp.]|uniref:T9SS type A sorting domain-containing protein n=1 Tax=Ekhidna sp. TaxID=2608089 RepID=UPI003C798412
MTKIKNLTTIAAILIGLLSVKAQVSGTFTVGPGADYETLPLAFTGINSAGGIDGDLILELQSDYDVTDYTTLGGITGATSYSVTIRPAADVTNLQINHDFRLNGTDNVIFDGANPVTGDKVVQINGEIRMYTHVRDVTFRNLKFNVQGQFGIYGSNGGAAAGAQYWDDIIIENNEFFTETPVDHSNPIYVIYSSPVYGAQSTWPKNIVIQNNKFYGFERTNTVGGVIYIRMKCGVKAYNNVFSHTFTEFMTSATAINHSYGHGEAINNTIYFDGGSTSQFINAYGLSFSAGTGGSGIVRNNIVSINSSGDGSSYKRGISLNNNYSHSNNNIYMYDDGVSTPNWYNSYDQEASQGYSSTVTFSEPIFTDIASNNFSLAGSSLTNPDFRSAYTTSVTTDHNGDPRHSNVPSKGAFEAPNMIADITSFSHANEYVDAVIDSENSTVLLEVTNGTDLSNIGPSIGTYYGASTNPTSGTLRNFTTPQDYTVTAEDGTTTDVWTATIVHQNDAPTDILLSSADIDENSSIGTVVGTFSSEDTDVSDTHTYELVTGDGSDDNALFEISGTELLSDFAFDYETKNSYSIRVRSDDNVAHGGTFEKEFTITINDLPDEAPTAIYLDNDKVVEGAPIGTIVGILSTEDIDEVDDHTYTLVSGTGDDGNGFFDIVDDQLVTATSFDIVDGTSYSVLIRTTDNGDASFDQAFTINIKEVNDGPQGSAASSEQKITPAFRYSYTYFGEDVAISNGYAIVGAHAHDYDLNEENWIRDAGAAFIFKKDEMGGWVQTQKLVRPSNRSSYDNFGRILAMDGDYAAISMPYEEGTSTGFSDGIILMYEKNESGTWEYKQELTPSGSIDDGIEFGYDVKLAGDYLVASAPYDAYDENGENYHSDAGAAYIFKRNASGVWEEVQKIVASDRETYGYYYGESVAISDGFVAIGAYEANSLAEDGVTTLEQTGAIYMYEENESGVWFEVAKLVASDREEYDYLGYYIDLDDNVLVASNYEKNSYTGQAYVFERIEGIWVETQIILPENSFEEQEFGISVAISNGTIAVGSEYLDPDTDDSGVYLFTKSGNEWIQSDIITPASYDNNSGFGGYISLSGDDIIVSDTYANTDSEGINPMSYSGAAYLFGLCSNPDLPTIEASDNQICDGTSITLSVGDAELNDALTWEWYSESCGGMPVGTGASIEVNPSETTTYFVRGEGACSSSTTCSFITIEVYELCPQNDILTFSLDEQTSDAVIDVVNHTVGIEVEVGTDVTNLTPSITVSQGANYSPSGAQDFTNTVIYTVTAEDGTSQDWEVSVLAGENMAPTLETAFQDLIEEEGFGSVQVSYAGAFTDTDGHTLNISVESSDNDVVTVEVVANNQIEIAEVGVGTSTITVTASDGFGGSVSDEFTFNVTEAPLGLTEGLNLKVYPNPTADFINVGATKSVDVLLIDLNGRTLQTTNGKDIQIDLRAIESGMYLLKISDGASTETKRIIKAN